MSLPPAQEESRSELALSREIMTLLYKNAGKEEFGRLRDVIGNLPQDSLDKELLASSVQMALTVRERFEEYQQRERGLNAVIETAHDLTAIRDLDQALQAIVHRARKLMNADIGYLSIYDRIEGDFYVRATDGAFSESFKQIRVPRDVGICGYVARNKSPYSSSDYGTDPRFSHIGQIDTAVTEEGIASILGVPLLSGGEVIGVLFVGDRYHRTYGAWEMSILSTLAAHASVAIENARLFEETQAALNQAGDANARLKKQGADTQIAAEAHEQLTSLVARGGGLKEICDMVAGMLGGHVEVIDEGEQAICASGQLPENASTANRHDKTRDRIHAALVESRIIGRSVTAYIAAHEVCRVAAAVGRGGLLGGLVLRTSRELTEVAVRIFERSSMVTAVVLLSQEWTAQAARQKIPALFRSLLSQPQHDLAQLAPEAARFGLHLSQPLYVAVLEAEEQTSGYLLRKLISSFETPHTLFDEVDNAVVFISALPSQDELLRELQVWASRQPGRSLTGVVSRQVAAPAALPAAYLSSRRCLATLHALGRSGAVVLEQELSLYAILFENRNGQDLDRFLSTVLGKLYQEGNPRSVELARTLLAYFDHGCNARAAAAEQAIHINTFRQRLETIQALVGDWDQGSRALEVHVALRLWQLRGDGRNR